MKLFLYLFISTLLLGGTYFFLVRETPPASVPAGNWESEAQGHLTALLGDQLTAISSKNWTAFDADLKKAEAHLALAPVGANADGFRNALRAYRSQQEMRNQLSP